MAMLFEMNDNTRNMLEENYNIVFESNQSFLIKFDNELSKITDILQKNIANYKPTHAIYLSIVRKATTKNDIKWLNWDCTQQLKGCKRIIKKYPEYKKDINEHERWLNSVYRIAIEDKAKELHDKKYITENYVDTLEGSYLNFKNIGPILSNMSTNKYNYEKIEKNLLKIVKNCSSLDAIKELRQDLNAGFTQLETLKRNTPDKAPEINKHIEWLRTTYRNALNEKAKELRN